MRKLVEPRGKFGIGATGRTQVGLDADRLENVLVGEGGWNVRIGGAARVDDCEIASDRGGEIHDHDSRKKLRLPQRMVLGREIVHREQAGARVLAEDAWNGARQPTRDGPHISRLRRVAADRRLPEGGDLEPRQRALDAEPPPARFDKRDVRGHAAGQRRDPGAFLRAQKAHAAQRLDQIAGLRQRMIAHGLDAQESLNMCRARRRGRSTRRSRTNIRGSPAMQMSAAASSTVPKRSIGIFERI